MSWLASTNIQSRYIPNSAETEEKILGKNVTAAQQKSVAMIHAVIPPAN